MKSENHVRQGTKQKIFMVAAQLFAEKGYSGASMKDIAEKAGIKSASIYNHYSAKELILDDLMDYYLKRMDVFYTKLDEISVEKSDHQNLEHYLKMLMLTYNSHEVELMYNLTRIVHHEQFNNAKAADALVGRGYRKYVNAHIHFFDRLFEAGLLKKNENNKYYGEIYARISLTFATQFLHPEIEPTITNQSELANIINKLIIKNE